MTALPRRVHCRVYISSDSGLYVHIFLLFILVISIFLILEIFFVVEVPFCMLFSKFFEQINNNCIEFALMLRYRLLFTQGQFRSPPQGLTFFFFFTKQQNAPQDSPPVYADFILIVIVGCM